MSKIKTLLASLTGLTAEEQAELRSTILAEAKAADLGDVTPESVARLTALAAAGEAVMEADALAAAAPAGGAVAAIAASRKGTKPTPGPEAAAPEHRASLVATMPGVDPTVPLTDPLALAQGMADTLKRMNPKLGPPRQPTIVASAKWTYPEERQLGDNAFENGRKMDAVTHPNALVASGGICAPVNVDYSVPTWSTVERPLRDGLPAFEATRGGIRFVQPPDMSALAGATTIWTEATDAAPAGATKPVLTIACGSELEVMVDAVPTRLQFGNMQGRFAPEQVAANTDLAMAAAARKAENNLLAQIQAVCTQDVTSPVLLGATRDLITVIDQAVASYRWLHRVSQSAVFTAIFPAWLRDLLRVDLARELAHDNSGAFNVLEISNAQIDALIRAHGVNPIWHIDGQAQNGSVYPLQGFAAQSGTHAINPFPAKTVWYLFPEGSIQFLDGGRLDLGVVRDSTLNATNDYELFVEVFEAVAFRGFSGGALQFVTSLCANGGSAGTISTAGACA